MVENCFLVVLHKEVVVLRVQITLVPNNEVQDSITIPFDFRRYFISLLKTCVNETQLAQRFQENKPGYSPYVFSVFFNKIVGIESRLDKLVVKPPVRMIFSTGLFNIMTAVCNGAVAQRNKETILGLTVRDVKLLPLKKIRQNVQDFRICGHAVLKGSAEYLDGHDIAAMEEAINTHIKTRIDFLHSEYGEEMGLNDFYPIKVLPPFGHSKGVCSHYGGKMTTIQGFLNLESKPEMLQFLYDYGLGVRTGQGFGLLEVINRR